MYDDEKNQKYVYDDGGNKKAIYEAPPPEFNDYEVQQGGHTGFAVASLVLSILSLILCCCMGFNFILAIPALIFGILALVKRYSGKGMAIAGIIISSIAIIVTGSILAIYGPIFSDAYKVSTHFESVRSNFEETGEIPDYLEKYTDEKYDQVWKNQGYDDFYDFFGAMLEEMGTNYDGN